MDGGAWWAAVHGVIKSWTRLSDFTFTFHFHALEKEMATHSSVLAWRIPGTGEPGGLLSMGLHRVGHDWSDLAVAAAASKPRQDDSLDISLPSSQSVGFPNKVDIPCSNDLSLHLLVCYAVSSISLNSITKFQPRKLPTEGKHLDAVYMFLPFDRNQNQYTIWEGQGKVKYLFLIYWFLN